MNTKATQLLYDAAGQPEMGGTHPGVCRVCGEQGVGVPFEEWVRNTFTNWDLLVPGKILCHACQFTFDEHSAALANELGKEESRYVRMRNYSHFVVEERWFPLSKGAKEQMTDILLRHDWSVAVIAQSGQKHIAFRATPHIVQFEEQQILDTGSLEVTMAVVEALYTQFSKTEIREANYKGYRIMEFGIDRWRTLEEFIAPRRGSKVFQLALFLAQKKEPEVLDEQYAEAARAHGGSLVDALAWNSERLQEAVSPQNMATVRGRGDGRGLHQQAEQVHQLDLL
jgi:hypothetical protein